ncbi:TRM11 family SAM-dependent methyltransferase [Gorillibacterium sp. sgz5001074]|uniref:TRM11 family SAM-dependent methyltransferase n=1 Tax=Gorillibacterium sp. sgz5001074 TaxID=3446695 RepID=UPI003F660D74
MNPQFYMYTFSSREWEVELVRMEQRTVFGAEAGPEGWLRSPVRFEPDRSPFVRQRLDVLFEAGSLEELVRQVDGFQVGEGTFKVRYVKTDEPVEYDVQRRTESRVGAVIRGTVDVREPSRLYGVAHAGGRWLFGVHRPSEAVWLRHQNKPQGYSTALNTRIARALVNLALPDPDRDGTRLLDPCCGIGTVLVEALSMGLDASGSDVNPLAVKGARINLAHYGMSDVVMVRDIGAVEGRYDAAVADLPYNLCSVSPPEEQLRILQRVRELAPRAVLVTTEEMDLLVEAAGLHIADRCTIPKGKLVRHILLCR